MKKSIAFGCVLTLAVLTMGRAGAEEVYIPDWPSLMKHHAAPDWFRDAKFGIYMHWGVYSVPAYGSEWYPRNMHLKDNPVYRHHAATWGEPDEFGYHDFVPMFKAEHFDPAGWADLFAQSGAKYAGLVVEHHDGFAMWDSELTPWNAADRGPQRDITGELAKAVREEGMRFAATFHHARNNQHMINRNGFLEWEGHYPRVEGWPTVSEDPELRMLYGNLPRNDFLELWKGKLFEVIDNYQPDLIWFDSWLDEIPETYQTAFLAYYFNRARQWGKEVVVTCKQRDLALSIAVEDFEKGRAAEITEFPFLTDDTISDGSWCYTENLKIKPLAEVIHVLIDIVSKNGQLLLNISPKADGTIPGDQRDVLLGLGKWLGRNGDAIYNTRPFLVYGEGPTQMRKSGHFVGKVAYQPADIRFTRNGSTLYAISLGIPENEFAIRTLGRDSMPGITVTGVSAPGCEKAVNWDQEADALRVAVPDDAGFDTAAVFAIQLEGHAAAVTGFSVDKRGYLTAAIRTLNTADTARTGRIALFSDEDGPIGEEEITLPPGEAKLAVKGRLKSKGRHKLRATFDGAPAGEAELFHR
jgi:alpha-L-fucosidase